MPRITQAQAIEHETEQQALAFFERTLSGLPDPRRRQGVRYSLRSVVVIALMAMICGSDDAEAMELWGVANGAWLSGFLELLCRDLAWLSTADRWPGLSFVVAVTRERTLLLSEKTSTETAYYIGSDPRANAAASARTIRRHWSIENELHWVLDLAFREDEARHRARNTAQNLTTLRHFALNVIKRDAKRKVGVANSRKRAGWDRNYLLQLLIGADSCS